MGAGSAKGLQQPDEDEEDRFSSSSEQWGNDQSASDDSGRKDRDTSPESDVEPKAPPAVENGESSGHEEMEGKRRGLFHFSKKKDESDKDRVDEFVDETNEDDKKKKGGTKNNKDNAKKDNEKKGFRLFGWRKDDKKNEKDEALDDDINDLEKTFDSLGIVGKNSWGDAPANPPKEAVDDLELLEPMRKRKKRPSARSEGHERRRGGRDQRAERQRREREQRLGIDHVKKDLQVLVGDGDGVLNAEAAGGRVGVQSGHGRWIGISRDFRRLLPMIHRG
ncbi:ABC transporter F family member 4-like [Penaeus indicus]|uniref:ABC transporter F family member 4-like n=1 Tax=Penaeus indicus TaxID=29960 RepID=UPI00300D569F